MKQISLEELTATAVQLRRDILSMIAEAGSGHPGGSLSAVELLTALYCKELRHDPASPGWPDRDRFILSKAHACPVLYVMLAPLRLLSKGGACPLSARSTVGSRATPTP